MRRGRNRSWSGRCASTKASYGPDHPSVATDLSNLALILRDLGDAAGGETAHGAGAAHRRGQLRTRPSSVATDLGNLALILQDLGDDDAQKGQQ